MQNDETDKMIFDLRNFQQKMKFSEIFQRLICNGPRLSLSRDFRPVSLSPVNKV